jgi:predicted Zn-dependent protease
LLFLKYGRDDETQADRLGFRYALTGGYDTREMIHVFEMLQRSAQLNGGGRLPEWQSTHPDPGNRITRVQGMVSGTTVNLDDKKVGGDVFLRRLDGLVYGVDPRTGFFQQALFLHPDLKFQLRFPTGWATQNAADAVTAVSSSQDALIQLRSASGSAAEAANGFFAQEGLQAGAQSRGTVHGNPAVTGEFTAQDDQGGSVRGIATFIEYDGATWGIMGFTVADRFATYSSAFRGTLGSFERLTDPAALAVQPLRMRIVPAPRAMTLQQFNAQLPSSIPLAELAIINGLAESSPLRLGQLVKRITGTPLPRVVDSQQ